MPSEALQVLGVARAVAVGVAEGEGGRGCQGPAQRSLQFRSAYLPMSIAFRCNIPAF